MDIKAIDTVYDGHKFRSRLEARWAVFFKESGINYDYEVEGFLLPDGTNYLPDFVLKNCFGYDIVYAEVKPETYNREQLIKPWLFTLFSDIPLVILNGSPKEGAYPVIWPLYKGECGGFIFSYRGSYKDQIKVANYARFEFGETPK
jgi:hypothetical protein